MFSLLDKQRMPLAELPAYLDRVGIYREFNALFFNLTPSRLAELLVGELVKAGAARIDAGDLVPATTRPDSSAEDRSNWSWHAPRRSRATPAAARCARGRRPRS